MLIVLSEKDLLLVTQNETAIFEHPWSEKQISDHFTSGNPIWGFYDSKGEMRGYLIASEVFGEWEIFRVAVLPEFRRTGIASEILMEFEKICAGGDSIFLEVNATNAPAVGLYSKMGFETVGRRKGYYSDGNDAILMMKKL
jgi:ribosomal-protein-alanine N-acetyltransferase